MSWFRTRPVVVAVLLCLTTALVVLLGAGGAWSDTIYLALHGWALPSGVWAAVSTGSVVALAVLYAVVGWWCRRFGLRTLAVLGAGGCGAVLAYLISEGVKLAMAQPRPCRALVDLAHCPAVGDWSYPSNHAVVAFALAAACVAARPRTAVIGVLLACLAGFARVAAGVHYPHDVLGGLVLALGVVAVTVIVLAPGLESLLAWSLRWRPARVVLGEQAADPATAPLEDVGARR